MDVRSVVTAILWLAILGLVILIATRVVTKTAGKASAAI